MQTGNDYYKIKVSEMYSKTARRLSNSRYLLADLMGGNNLGSGYPLKTPSITHESHSLSTVLFDDNAMNTMHNLLRGWT